jgi:hypothetical protein
LSPSFNIHARFSEKEGQVENKAEVPSETKEPVKHWKEEKQEVKNSPAETPVQENKRETESTKEEIKQSPPTEPAKVRMPLAIGINDKFRFMNELFSQNSTEYNIAIEQINNVNNWNDAEIYLNSLKAVYEWDEKNEAVLSFFAAVKKRFQ